MVTTQKSVILGTLAAMTLLLPLPTLAQSSCDRGELPPIMIYRNAGPPIVIPNPNANPCEEERRKYLKAQRHRREKLAQHLAKEQQVDSRNQEVSVSSNGTILEDPASR